MVLRATSAEPFIVKWKLAGSFVTSGSALARFWRSNNAGGREFLQAGFATWGASHDFAMVASDDAEGFALVAAMPAAALDYAVTWEFRHSDPTLPLVSASALVVAGVLADATLARKLLRNRLVVDGAGVATLYDDDAATPLYTWSIQQVDGTPATPGTDPSRRVPT